MSVALSSASSADMGLCMGSTASNLACGYGEVLGGSVYGPDHWTALGGCGVRRRNSPSGVRYKVCVRSRPLDCTGGCGMRRRDSAPVDRSDDGPGVRRNSPSGVRYKEGCAVRRNSPSVHRSEDGCDVRRNPPSVYGSEQGCYVCLCSPSVHQSHQWRGCPEISSTVALH